ncbi:cytochrome P450 [Russula dissimulans]|nr:cytochrome P450 [Russula dissimulans]
MPDDLRVSFLAGSFVVVSLFISWYLRRDPLLDAIPTVGFSDPILSYFSALKFNFDGIRMLKEGYEKVVPLPLNLPTFLRTSPGLFKIATFRKWMVLAAGPELIEDIRKAPDNVLSFREPILEFLQAEYTLNVLNIEDEYHTGVVRSQLTRSIATTFKELREELIKGLDDWIPTRDDQWVKVPVMEMLQRVICCATNRVFIGIPLCFIVSHMLSNLPSQIRQETEFIRPMVEEWFKKMEEYGKDWDDQLAKGVERSLDGLARRMLLVNFVAIHSTSQTFMQVLYRLLANPEYIEPLRQEVEAVVAEEGWTKAAIHKMHKIDSFLWETQRVEGLGILVTKRLALRPFTFSNGVTIPAGTLVAVPASAAHKDERIFPNPEEFDGFRFAKLRESESDAAIGRYQTVSVSTEQLAFGIGKHACPGRFFAANETKLLLAHIVVTYDMKFEEGKEAPRELCIAGMRIPRPTNVMFRERQK